MAPKRDEFPRFWEKVDASGGLDSCWLWTAGKNAKGYGIFGSANHYLAHRWAYEALRGPLPEGLVSDHLCRTPACVNPWHVEMVTQKVNVHRGFAPPSLHAKKVVCSRGHNEWGIRADGYRSCRACAREWSARRARTPAYRAWMREYHKVRSARKKAASA